MADLRISELATLAGANLASGDFLPIADTSASETKKITVTDLVGNATTLIADATIPSAKILFGAGTISGTSLTAGTVNATQLANDAVTAAKLADESSVDLVTTLPASGAFVGQLALDTDDSKIYCWNGSTWVSVKAAGGVNAVFGSTSGVINIVATTVGDEVTISATLDNTANAAEFLAGPTGAAGTVSYRPIVGADLPTATTTSKGAVIVNGNGLSLSGDTLVINNSVTAEQSNFHIVQYDGKGLITSGRVINAGDIPVATSSTNGILKPGTGLNVTGSGALNHNNSVGTGSGVKVSFDNEGHITGVAALSESDIPNLSAAKLTTGTLDIARVGTNSVIGSKLANFSVSKIGSDTPTPDHIGQFFFNPISRDLFLWDGNVYQPVGISAGEIVFAGTYDATTNLLTSVTAQGLAAGFTNNAALPAASALNNRYYVVVSNTGTGVSPAPIVALQPPDLLLSNGTSYVLVDVSQTVTAQTANGVIFTATGNISATNVQAAIAEVDSEKLAKAGDTLTGQLLVSNTGSLVFEGATDNAFETTLGVVDPTADRTINLPDVSGTVITSGDTGSVTSTMILDGTILDADVNANAAITGTKISPDFGSQAITTTGAFTHALGNSSVPSITFTGDLNTGIYSPGADQLSITTAGTQRLMIDSNGQIEAASLGTAAAPVYSFTTDANTGIYSPGADQLAIATGGTQRLTTDTAAVTSTLPIVYPLGAAATPSVTFTGDLNTGIYSPGADQVAISTGGSGRVFINASGNLGVGVSNPAEKLQLADGNIYLGTGDRIVYNGGASGNLTFQTGTLGNLIFSTQAGSERLRITSAGLVGIGTSSPSAVIHTYSNISGGNPATSGSSDPNVFARFQGGSVAFDIGGTLAGLQWIQPRLFNNYASNFGLALCPNGGNVGIGTTTPSVPLEVNGSIYSKISTSGDAALAAVNSFASFFVLQQSDKANLYTGAGQPIVFTNNNIERARIDSSGRLLVGTSSARSTFAGSLGAAQVQLEGTGLLAWQSITEIANNSGGPTFVFAKNRSSTNTIVQANDELGTISFQGNDGTDFAEGARIRAEVDGTPGTNDMPGRIVLSTTLDGASSPTEQWRITNDGVLAYNQVTPTSKSAAATLTVAELKTGIIQYTGAAATLTLPTGTLTEGGFSGIYTNLAFEWSVINTGSGTCTIGAGSGHTIVGSGSVAINVSARFVSRRTAANTFVSYRLS